MTTEFPQPIRMGGRLKFIQHEIDDYVRTLAGLPAVARDPAAPIRLLDAQTICADLGIDRRTLGRRVKGRIRGEAA
jgi:predicted DNA-binding transcriptional regulator AlpA